MARQKKVLEYRRARFLDDSQNLEQLARQAWGQFGTQAERTITYSDDRSTSGLRSRDCLGNGFAVHCGRYTDGQGVGTIPTLPAAEVEIGERPPEPGENFLNSDLMALIRGNHVLSMNCGRNAGSLRIFLQQLFRKAGFADGTRQFELAKIGSPDKLAIIEKFGVKSVDLTVDISDAASVELIDDYGGLGYWHSIKSKISETLSAVTAKDDSIEQLRNAEKGSVKVSINVPKGDLESAKHGLDDFAGELMDDEEAEGFVIHLRDGGGMIKLDEVSVRKEVRLEAAANSVSVHQAWDAMEVYMGELEESGQLEA